jgi:hypothetical protein
VAHHVKEIALPSIGGTNYRFTRMSAEEFSAALETHHLSPNQFRRIYGPGSATVAKWLDGIDDIPPWVAAVVATWSIPGVLERARVEAERRLISEAARE